MLDPAIVDAMLSPARAEGDLSAEEDRLLQWIAEGRPLKAISAAAKIPPDAVNDAIESLFFELAQAASEGRESALRRLRLLQKPIVGREYQGESLSRMLPGRLAEQHPP